VNYSSGVTAETAVPSARHTELLEAAYGYVLEHGLAEMSLRPLAAAIGSSPRVLLYLFGSKDGLVRALLNRARRDELALLDELRAPGLDRPGLDLVAGRVWAWLAAEEHRALLSLWVEAYARSLVDPGGPWADFARSTVQDWLAVLASAQPVGRRDTDAGRNECTLVLTVLRGALLDLLATGDTERLDVAVHQYLATLRRR
jgi:AcrR family transcriptional regulator